VNDEKNGGHAGFTLGKLVAASTPAACCLSPAGGGG
jgi:hypothetical protein